MRSEQPAIEAVVFDAYGTLLDVHSAMARHALRLGGEWERLSAEWRAKQLEYTWIRSLAGPAHHQDFATLTETALRFVAARHGIGDEPLLADLLTAYRALDSYPEAPSVLTRLRHAGRPCAILSNGEPRMLAEGVRAAGLDGLLDAVLSVESAGIYKPDRRVYELATRHFDRPAQSLAFISSNPWDAFGAQAFGFQVFWVNRGAQPDEYGLRASATEITDLAGLPDLVANPAAASAG